MVGKLYDHKVSPSEIKKMTFSELRYWANWNKLIDEGYKRARDAATKGRGK
jgi:hypothetical protein